LPAPSGHAVNRHGLLNAHIAISILYEDNPTASLNLGTEEINITHNLIGFS